MPDPVDVALVGVGGVGGAVLDRLADGELPIRLVAATDSQGTVTDPTGLDPARLLAAKRQAGTVTAHDAGTRHAWRAPEATRHVDADVLVQATPTDLDDPSRSVATIEAALASGAHVVTAAKDALACQPDRVRRAGDAAGRRVLASAAVGASVPVLETLDGAFHGDRVASVDAVLNGSTTFVLSRMAKGDRREAALAKAREAGLLEADPTLDLSGRDAAAKAALIHQHLFGSSLSLDAVETQGIGSVDEAVCRQARTGGFAIRLVARIDADGARVAPVEIDRDGPLAVDGPACAVRLTLDGAGEIALAGPGAGPRETASAVVSDVLRSAAADREPRPRRPATATVHG